MEIANYVLGQPDAEIVPPSVQAEDLPSIRRRFAKAVREEMDERKRALKILTYDDVLSRLRTTLFDPQRGPAACAPVAGALRRRPGRRVPGHRPRPVGHHAPGLRAGRGDARADRGSQAGDLRLPRRRRPRLPRGARRGAVGVDPRRQLAQRPGAARGVRRARSPTPSSDTPASPTGTIRAADANLAAQARRRLRSQPLCGPHRPRRRRPRPARRRPAGAARRPSRAELHRPGSGGGGRPPPVGRPGGHRPAVATGPNSSGRTLHPGHIAVLVRTNSHAVTVRDALHGAGVPGRDRRFRLGLRHRAGAGVAPIARGARTADGAGPRLAGRARPAFVGWTPEEVATAGEERVGGPALVAAPVGGPPARPGHRLPLRERQQLARRAGARAGPSLRRAFHDGPAPRRPVAARGRCVRRPRADGHGHLARPTDP